MKRFYKNLEDLIALGVDVSKVSKAGVVKSPACTYYLLDNQKRVNNGYRMISDGKLYKILPALGKVKQYHLSRSKIQITELNNFDISKFNPGINYTKNIHDVHNSLIDNDCKFYENLSKNTGIININFVTKENKYTIISTDILSSDIELIKELYNKYDFSKNDLLKFGYVAKRIWKQLDNNSHLFHSLDYEMFDFFNKVKKNSVPFAYIKDDIINKDIVCNGLMLDINSAYPTCYVENVYPCRYLIKVNTIPDKPFVIHFKADVKLKKDGIACIRHDLASVINGKTTYINDGNIDFYCTSVKYYDILDNYDISNLDIIEIYTWTNTIVGFGKNFVDELFKIKATTTGEVRSYTKRVLNSLNGSFATNPNNYYRRYYGYEGKQANNWRALNISYLYMFTVDYASSRLIKEIKKYKDNVLYANVDSLFLKEKVDIEYSDKLGAFKNEGNLEFFKVLGFGCYMKNDKVKFIGCSDTSKITRASFKLGMEYESERYLIQSDNKFIKQKLKCIKR